MKTKSIALTLAAALLPASSAAKEVTVSIEATVDYVYDPSYQTRLDPGDVLKGTVTFDPDAADADPSPELGDRRFEGAPFGITLDTGKWQVSTAGDAGAFRVRTEGPSGRLGFYSQANTAVGLGETVRSVYWALSDALVAPAGDGVPADAASLLSFKGQTLGIDLAEATVRATVRKVALAERPQAPAPERAAACADAPILASR